MTGAAVAHIELSSLIQQRLGDGDGGRGAGAPTRPCLLPHRLVSTGAASEESGGHQNSECAAHRALPQYDRNPSAPSRVLLREAYRAAYAIRISTIDASASTMPATRLCRPTAETRRGAGESARAGLPPSRTIAASRPRETLGRERESSVIPSVLRGGARPSARPGSRSAGLLPSRTWRSRSRASARSPRHPKAK